MKQRPIRPTTFFLPSRTVCLPFALATLIGIAALSSSLLRAQKTMIQPSDIANIKRGEAPHISHDGKLVVYTVETPVAAGKHRDAHIWISPTDHAGAAHPFAYSSAAENSPDWSPDGTHIAFLSDRPNPLAESVESPFHFSIAPGTNRKDIPAVPDSKSTKDGADAPPKGEQLW